MSACTMSDYNVGSEQGCFWMKNFEDSTECVFKKCCEKYKKKGKHCKKCPKK
ncbi:hypothetical protein SAMN04487996_11833 [Dyadobacter soli]|uniref:Uncharacterized protein n=1 Tax=Dyadobacter soli TaxID=659014 RepID=A0A1G7TRN0_9BACT|nr:hypothetical protein [Dyadobacter soli]SDG37911.1 hypothetical protein SAMN04487996_11833 [Dyadobacter soli]